MRAAGRFHRAKEEFNGVGAVVTYRREGSRGSDPRPLGLTMGWLLNRTLGSDPVHQGSSMPEGQTNPQHTIPSLNKSAN
jgi:hypothetical protein